MLFTIQCTHVNKIRTTSALPPPKNTKAVCSEDEPRREHLQRRLSVDEELSADTLKKAADENLRELQSFLQVLKRLRCAADDDDAVHRRLENQEGILISK